MIQDLEYEPEPPPHSEPSVWQKNHGNLLSAFVGMILLVGLCVLLYQQNRFVPFRIPTGMIQPPEVSGDGIDSANVMIVVTGSASDFGSMQIAIYASEASFGSPDRNPLARSLPIIAGEAIWALSVDDLPEEMVISAFHDENDDGEMNQNHLAVPTERYGFSRNARGTTKPPPFAEAVIPRPESGSRIEIFVR